MHLPLHELQPATPGEERKPAEQRWVQAITTGHPEIATAEHLAQGFRDYGFFAHRLLVQAQRPAAPSVSNTMVEGSGEGDTSEGDTSNVPNPTVAPFSV